MMINCGDTTCNNCPANEPCTDVICSNYAKQRKSNEEERQREEIRRHAENIKWLTGLLKDPDEISMWKDEFDITIKPEFVNITEILETKYYPHGVHIIFIASLNEDKPIKIQCNAWDYPPTRDDPGDHGLEMEPIIDEV